MRDIARICLILGLFWPPAADAQPQLPIEGRIAARWATSACLGEPVSPVCAAETLLACWARANLAHCRAIAGEPRAGERAINALPSGDGEVQYTIERITRIRREDITDDLRAVEWFKPGYALVELVRRTCARGPALCEDEPWEEMQIVLRPDGGRWLLVVWRSDNEPDSPPEIPEDLRQPSPQ